MLSLLNAPASVSFQNGTTVAAYFKSFINFLNAQTQLHADKVFVHYFTNNEYKSLTYSHVDSITTKLALAWADTFQEVDVISYISDHNVDYFLTVIAIMKLRKALLLISPRNSERSTAELIKKTNSKLVLMDKKYESKLKPALPDIRIEITEKLDIEALLSTVPTTKERFEKNGVDLNLSDEDLSKPALIFHSSGTTGSQKLINYTNRVLLCLPTYFALSANNTMNSSDVFLSSVPLFHTFGTSFVCNIISIGGSIVFMERLPPSKAELYKSLVDNNVTVMGAPPIILEQLYAYTEEREKENDTSAALKSLKYIIYGGAPIKKELGLWFKNRGVHLASSYGSSEMGSVMSSSFGTDNDDSTSMRPFFRDDCGDLYGKFEVYDDSSAATPEDAVLHFYMKAGNPMLMDIKPNRPDGGFSSYDLFRKDLSHPGYYHYVGRCDDILIMNNGEKTDPLPMEATLRQDLLIKQAAVIASGRDCAAALVELDLEFALEYSPDEITRKVHKAVEKVNQECPNHSKLLPQMVKILPFDKELPSTDKGTIRRKVAEAMYHDTIEELYKQLIRTNGNLQRTNKDSFTWTADQVEDFLVSSVSHVLNIDEKELLTNLDQSAFSYGLNSLTAIQLRNLIFNHFENISQTFVYQHTSIQSMCEALTCSYTIGESEDYQLKKKSVQQTQDLATAYIEKAKNDFQHIPINNSSCYSHRDNVILLTGATGFLGSFMLQYLLQNKQVKKVYCCVREKKEGDGNLFQRLLDVFKRHSLDLSLLYTSKENQRLKVLPMRFNAPFLGFSEAFYHHLRNEVTIVQHCAWLLDFNITIDHYDKECIAPFYDLLKFAYHHQEEKQQKPIQVHFISSISASAAYNDTEVLEEPLPLDANIAMSMGYAQSKFIVEVLLSYLKAEKNLPCFIERLGQVCGDSMNGVWKTNEQYPLMLIGGGAMMHKMPALSDEMRIDWIPVDYAAQTIVDIMLHDQEFLISTEQSIYHIVNPNVIAWNNVLDAMKSSGMSFDIVSFPEWIELLAQNSQNPAYKLIGYYETNDTFRMPAWSTKKTMEIAPIMKTSPVIDANFFRKFLDFWREIGFYNVSK